MTAPLKRPYSASKLCDKPELRDRIELGMTVAPKFTPRSHRRIHQNEFEIRAGHRPRIKPGGRNLRPPAEPSRSMASADPQTRFLVNGGDVSEGVNFGATVIPNLDSVGSSGLSPTGFDAEYGRFQRRGS